MSIHTYSDDISFSPLLKDLKGYSWGTLKNDSFAAFSVALLTIPQAIAYAMLAGLPISCALFASIYSAIVASLCVSSRHLLVGPSNAIAILMQAGTAEILFTHYRDLGGPERAAAAIQVMSQMVFLTGIIQLLAAGCKLGRLTQFVSHSVIIGYLGGTAIAVVINQLFIFLGMPRMTGVHSLYERAIYLITNIQEVHLPTCLLGIGCIILLVLLKRAGKGIPAAVIMFIAAGLVAYLTDMYLQLYGSGFIKPFSEIPLHAVSLVDDSGDISELIPQIHFPFFNTGIMNELLPVAFALALLSIMESTSVSKTIASTSGQRLSTNQEIFGVGMGNLVSALTGGLPVSGSPSRSSMNCAMGGQTRFAGVLTGIFVGIFLFGFGFLITRIPLTALAALLLVSAAGIINREQFLVCFKATRSDAFVLATTLLACIFFSLDVAFYIGVVLSITLYLKKAAIPQLVEYDVDEAGDLKNINFTNLHEQKEIRVIKVEGELFFGAADLFQHTLKSLAEDDTNTKVIILQLKNARDIDATACLALQQLHDCLRSTGRLLIACGITQPVWDVLSDSGMVEHIGKENLYIFDERRPHHYLQKVILRAKRFIESSKKGTSDTTIPIPIEENHPVEEKIIPVPINSD